MVRARMQKPSVVDKEAVHLQASVFSKDCVGPKTFLKSIDFGESLGESEKLSDPLRSLRRRSAPV